MPSSFVKVQTLHGCQVPRAPTNDDRSGGWSIPALSQSGASRRKSCLAGNYSCCNLAAPLAVSSCLAANRDASCRTANEGRQSLVVQAMAGKGGAT